MTDAIQAAAPYGAIISIDQEGGTVARLREGFTESPGAMALSSAQNAESWTEKISHMLGEELRALGIHWNYAPTVDISYNAENPSVGTRAFGSDAARVSQLSAAAVRGFQRAGIAATAKHFPGLGDTAVDTHIALPALDTSLEHLLQYDLDPYRAVIAEDVASVMITHVMYNALDSQHPATLSPVVVHQLLRGELGYKGVVCTDCMEMQAITDHYGSGESAVMAALAGIDAILISHKRERQQEAYEALLEAVHSGRLPLSMIEAANARLAHFKQLYLKPRADLSAIRSPEHLRLTHEAARATLTVLRKGDALPLQGNVGVIEFPSFFESGIVESGGLTGLASQLKARLLEAEIIIQSAKADPEIAYVMAERVDTLVLVVRNAHLNPPHFEIAQEVMKQARRVVLVCLRNPYDASLLPGAETILCSCGDSTPSITAVVEALMGDFVPDGVLPVEVTLS